MGRKSAIISWFVIIAGLGLLFIAWEYLDFRSSAHILPDGMTLAGFPVGGMTREQALNAIEVALATPLEVIHPEHELSLPPDSVDLRYHSDQTAASLNSLLVDQGNFDDFLEHLLRYPPEPVDIPIAASYSVERLNGFLARIARTYDQPPQDPVPLPTSRSFRPGQPGYEVDVDASRDRLSASLVSPTERTVELVVRTEPAPPLTLAILGRLIESLLDRYTDVIPGIFVKDLQTGDEMEINGDVAYAGLSVLKIAILEEAYRALDLPPGAETTKLISETMTLSGNFTANLLLRDVIGDGNGARGVERLTSSMRYLGLVNTFMATLYDEEVPPPNVITPANSRTDVTTYPDPYMQTTPVDVGLLLEMVYQCSHGGGALIAAYPGAFTADECSQMIHWMSNNPMDRLIEAGFPIGTRTAHKHGWRGDTHADAGLVFTPGGTFVLVVFLYRPQWLVWEESSPLFADIAAATYNYFNPTE